MAKKETTEEKIPVVVLSEEETVAIEQVQTDDAILKETAPERTAEVKENEAKVEEIANQIISYRELEEGSPEWFALRRKKREPKE